MTNIQSLDPWHVTDGIITIRPPRSGDAALLIAGRDEQWQRWMGPGSDNPQPTACVLRGDEIIGWVDYEGGHEWLAADEVNVGYNVFAKHRGQGFASRAVCLLLHRMSVEGVHRRASVVIDHGNDDSLRVALACGFHGRRAMGSSDYLVRTVPPLDYADGDLRIRRHEITDAPAHQAAIDDEQIRWMWRAEEHGQWQNMTPGQRVSHVERWLQSNRDAFASGPSWAFAVDNGAASCVAFVGCDLANPDTPLGEANLSYSCHPDHRGRGYVKAALALALRFLAEHTATRVAHLRVDADNAASLAVARSHAQGQPRVYIGADGRSKHAFTVDVRPYGRC